MNKEDQL